MEDEVKKEVQAYKEMKEAFDALGKAYHKLWREQTRDNKEWRNLKVSYWRDICLKYDENKLLNCNGDVFYIKERFADEYIGRRVLWNFKLSEEKYLITETNTEDYLDYKIEVYND